MLCGNFLQRKDYEGNRTVRLVFLFFWPVLFFDCCCCLLLLFDLIVCVSALACLFPIVHCVFQPVAVPVTVITAKNPARIPPESHQNRLIDRIRKGINGKKLVVRHFFGAQPQGGPMLDALLFLFHPIFSPFPFRSSSYLFIYFYYYYIRFHLNHFPPPPPVSSGISLLVSFYRLTFIRTSRSALLG